ncbi:MAG: acyl carrier protein [Cyclobacteriaceae bacterium]|nr:acyl carrier protein [Cyclobacteriaceae bacterium HetDA_MAG_MS6]
MLSISAIIPWFRTDCIILQLYVNRSMDRDQISEDLKTIIEPYVIEKEKLQTLGDEVDLINDLQINSAHIVDIVLDIEEKYDIMIEDDAINRMNTIGESISIIHEKVGES